MKDGALRNETKKKKECGSFRQKNGLWHTQTDVTSLFKSREKRRGIDADGARHVTNTEKARWQTKGKYLFPPNKLLLRGK